MTDVFDLNNEYKTWLESLKKKVKTSQIKAAVKVNTELLLLYWDIGKAIIDKQQNAAWGDALIPQLSKDLTAAFPGMKGFSRSNLFYIRKWVLLYNNNAEIVQQLAGQMRGVDFQQYKNPNEFVQQLVSQIPWGHHMVIIDKCETVEQALFYIRQTLENNWSRAVLSLRIESKLHLRSGTAIHNFAYTLDKIQAKLARETLKNPYNFDFLTIGVEAHERDLETALIDHIRKFLLELGQGFAFIGQQYPINVGDSDFFIDLLFFHTKLRCYIVVELKVTAFQPEYAGKLNFYLNIIDDTLKHATDQPSIGILLCKTPNKVMVEYSLKNINNPLGIAEYILVESVPENLKGQLPSIEDLENELQ